MSGRVLIIDDEENIRQMLRLTLETADCEVGEAGDEGKRLRSSVANRPGMSSCWISVCR